MLQVVQKNFIKKSNSTNFYPYFLVLVLGLGSCQSTFTEAQYTLMFYCNKEIWATYSVVESEEFSISWIHSVEGEKWEEYFIVTDANIILQATRFRTFGAGVPYDAPLTSFDSGWVKMSGFSYIVDPLYIRVGERTAHMLTIQGQQRALPLGRVLVVATKKK